MTNETAIVHCGTSKGEFTMELHRSWSPIGYDRAVELFGRGFYDESHFYRVIPKFLDQVGISYTTNEDLKRFARTPIPDDPRHDPVIEFQEGTISFAGSGNNSRTSQLFISYGQSKSLGTRNWETPLGMVIDGMEHIRNLHSNAGDKFPFAEGPVQGKTRSGPSYIEDNFPLTDKFLKCKVRRMQDGKEEKGVSRDSIKNKHSLEVELPTTEVQHTKTAVTLQANSQTFRLRGGETNVDHDMIKLTAILLIVSLSVILKLAMRQNKAPRKSS